MIAGLSLDIPQKIERASIPRMNDKTFRFQVSTTTFDVQVGIPLHRVHRLSESLWIHEWSGLYSGNIRGLVDYR